MFKKSFNKLWALLFPDPNDTAKRLLALPDSVDYNPQIHMNAVKEAMRYINLDTFDTVTTRDLIGITIPLRQRKFAELSELLIECNDAIANEADSRLEKLMKRHKSGAGHDVDLDVYFFDEKVGSTDVRKGMETLRNLVQANHAIVSQLESSYYPRMMSLVYYDIRLLTQTVLDIVEGKETK